ncbi:hypothetical protein LTR48_000614, partial [Friedmanniomyces endolithicus]
CCGYITAATTTMPPRPTPNLEHFFVEHYKTAHSLLLSDVPAAKRIFADLLENPRLPLFIRTQCNAILAQLTGDIGAADLYLLDARHVLGLFKESRSPPSPDPLGADIRDMEESFEEIERDIAYRREHPEEEDDLEAEDRSPEMHEPDSVVAKVTAASDNEEMLTPKAKPTTVYPLLALDKDEMMLDSVADQSDLPKLEKDEMLLDAVTDQPDLPVPEEDEMLLGSVADQYDLPAAVDFGELSLGESVDDSDSATITSRSRSSSRAASVSSATSYMDTDASDDSSSTPRRKKSRFLE